MRVYNDVLGSVSTNCYYLCNQQTNECIIVDPAGQFETISRRITSLGMQPKAVFLTHGHFDHIMATDRVREEYGIKVYASKDEQEIIGSSELNLSSRFGFSYRTKADELLSDGQNISVAGFDIKCIATPGHTKGGMCFYFPAEEVLISGDTLFCGSVGRTDFPTGSGSVLGNSIREKLFVLPDDTIVYPGHGEATTIGYEKKYNPCL